MHRRGVSTLLSALLLLTTFAVPAAAREASPADTTLAGKLGRERVARSADTGRVTFVHGTSARPAATAAELGRPATARAAARAFMERYGADFGITDATRDLAVSRVSPDGHGRTFVRYQQLHRGVPVLGGDLHVQVDRASNVVSANGEATADRTLSTTPTITAAQATRTALAAVAKDLGVPTNALRSTAPRLWVYDPALLGGPALPHVRLVWRMDVKRGVAFDDLVLVDAHRDVVALRISNIAHAKNRIICDARGAHTEVPCSSSIAERTEGEGAADNAEVNRAYAFAGDTYDFFKNRFDRDSVDGSGLAMIATVRFCFDPTPCSVDNAQWNGSQTLYSSGLAVDDVVAHEFAHGVTQFTSRLFYYYQSGAINEALSDIFGEFVDLGNGSADDGAPDRWLIGEGSSLGAIRNMKDPPAFGDPDSMRDADYTADAGENDAGGVHQNSGVANKAAYLMVDGSAAEPGGGFNGQTISPLGIDKAAAIWYRVEAQYLGSGSDYADLGAALNQACTDLTGTTPKQNAGTPSPTGAITASDCTEVGEVVTATEMALQPTVPGTAAPHAPVCTTGTPSNVFFDDMENPASDDWTAGAPGTKSVAWYYPQTDYPGGFDPTYATSGDTNIYGDDFPKSNDSFIRLTTGVALPPNAFLHFAHAYGFEDSGATRYDGGVIEYSTEGAGGPWIDAGSLIIDNPYNGTLVSGNALGARRAFTAESNGYISSRLNLASLAGKTARFRFRLGTDSSNYDYGWYIDDFRIYTCATSGDTTPPTVTAPDTDFRKVSISSASSTSVLPFAVRFTATDPSAIRSTDLERSQNGGTFTDVPHSPVNATSVNVSLAPNSTNTHRFRAAATDDSANQNTSGFANGPVFKIRAYQNGSSSIVQAGAWTNQNGSSFFGGSVRYGTSASLKQELSVTGTDFAVVSTRGPNRGKLDVYVDDAHKARIDLYNGSTQYRRIVYTISFPSAGQHEIEVRPANAKNANSSGKRADFDAFLVLTP